MQWKKLTAAQRKLKGWRERRNHLVCKLLDANPQMLRHEALKQANRMMRGK